MAALFLYVLMTSRGFAHEGSGVTLPNGGWSLDPWLVVPLYVVAISFFIGTLRLWRRAGLGRGILQWQAACFWTGWSGLALALMSPLHVIAERMLTAHMIEHELIMAVAAPLLLLSRPLVAFVWAIPMIARRWLGTVAGLSPIVSVWLLLTDAAFATPLHVGTVLAWHMPVLFESAITYPALHKLQHMSFLTTALLYWWAVLSLPRRNHGVAALHLFATMMAISLLGALLTLSPHLWYSTYSSPPFGFTPLEDQQLAGLLMWIPGCAVYAIAALCFMATWIGSRERKVAPVRHAERLENVAADLNIRRIA
jgi:putative membrane protein